MECRREEWLHEQRVLGLHWLKVAQANKVQLSEDQVRETGLPAAFAVLLDEEERDLFSLWRRQLPLLAQMLDSAVERDMLDRRLNAVFKIADDLQDGDLLLEVALTQPPYRDFAQKHPFWRVAPALMLRSAMRDLRADAAQRSLTEPDDGALTATVLADPELTAEIRRVAEL